MSKKRMVCFISLATAVVVTATGIGVNGEHVYATALEDITSDSIEAKKDEISDAKAEQNSIKSSISNMESIVAGLESQKSDLDKYIASIDSTMAGIEDNIEAYEALITETEAELVRKEGELASAEEQEADQYEAMKEHIQFLYEQGTAGYFEAILRADSFADMLNRAEYVEEMAAYDDRILQEYILQREYLELCKESLEQEKVTLDESKAALEAEQSTLETVRSQKSAELAAFEHDISLTEAQIKELEADLEYQTNLIASLEKEITEEQKEILKQNGVSLGYGDDGFAWPAPQYIAVTSDFGWRSDPFTGYRSYHNGVDLAAAKGTPIVAAYDGIVGQAGYNSSMGNYIYLEHGDGLRTIYLHASELYVEKDDVVLKGDVIAAVGSTGRSTGPHLHFSVRLNGEYVSPWNYLSR